MKTSNNITETNITPNLEGLSLQSIANITGGNYWEKGDRVYYKTYDGHNRYIYRHQTLGLKCSCSCPECKSNYDPSLNSMFMLNLEKKISKLNDKHLIIYSEKSGHFEKRDVIHEYLMTKSPSQLREYDRKTNRRF